MITIGELMRQRTSSDPHIYGENDAHLNNCYFCHRRRRDPIHWSREEDRAEMQRRFDRANPRD